MIEIPTWALVALIVLSLPMAVIVTLIPIAWILGYSKKEENE